MNQQENKMATMPVKELVLVMSWPIMLSMLIQALYNLVDGIFVSRVSEGAFLALGYAFPAQSLMIAICAGTGVGVNALLSRRLGENNPKEAGEVAMHSYLIYFLSFLAFALFGVFLSEPFIALFTTDAQVLRYGTSYLQIVTIGSLGMCMQFSAERILQASGNSIGPMIIQGAGALFNIIFDPILIFGLGPFPAMGVVGAAVATIAGQWLGMILGFIMVARNKVVVFHLKDFRFDRSIVGNIYRVGLPSILMQSLSTVVVFALNKLLGMISDAHVFVLTAYYKIQSFVFMPVFGLNNGTIPIIGFNYGAKQPQRIHETIRFALLLALGIMCVGTLLFWIIPAPLLALFQATDEILQVGVPALRIISLCFPMAAVSIILGGMFQATAAPLYSLICSLLRTLIVLVPAAALFAYFYPQGVWFSFVISDLIAMLAATLFYRTVGHKRIAQIEHA